MAESFCARISVPVILILCALLLRHRKSRCGEYLKLKDSLGRLPFLEGRSLSSFWTLTIDLCSCIPVKAESGILSKRKHNHLAVGRPFGKAAYNNKGHPMQWMGFWNTFSHPGNWAIFRSRLFLNFLLRFLGHIVCADLDWQGLSKNFRFRINFLFCEMRQQVEI